MTPDNGTTWAQHLIVGFPKTELVLRMILELRADASHKSQEEGGSSP